MSKEQIEEMAKITCQMFCRDKEKKCAGVQDCDMKCLHYQRCEALYNAGYRKQSEGEWISNRQTDEFICSLCGAIAPVDCLKEAFYESKFCPNCGARMKGGAE